MKSIKTTDPAFFNQNNNAILWIDLASIHKNLHGLNTETLPLSRLPQEPRFRKALLELSRHTAGVYLEFETNALDIWVQATLASKSYMGHMTATAQIGFDLYQKVNQTWVFLSTTKIDAASYEIKLFSHASKENRTYRLYFPLYISVLAFQLGINSDASYCFIKNHLPKILCYGTSITQGGCATRPGMAYPAILGRALPFEVLNFGFSGNAFLDLDVANYLSTIENVSYIVIEAEANLMHSNVLEKYLEAFIETLKTSKSNPSILLISHFPDPKALVLPDLHQQYQKNRTFQKQISKKTNIHFLDGFTLFSSTHYEETVDSTHLTDLGFHVLAKKIQKKLLALKK